MSVGFTFRVDIRPYSGYADPSLPVASWIGQGGAVGNASGGVLNMDFNFQLDASAGGVGQSSELWSLEQMTADNTSENSTAFTLETFNLDNLTQQRPGTTQVWQAETVAISSAGLAAYPLRNDLLPLWLGAPNRDEGAAGLRFRWPNTDLRLFFVSIQGYMWGPRSVLAEGGPRRPAGGLFRT